MDASKLLADRTRKVQFSGIRKFFELASRMKDPCDLSIGLPDYDAPDAVKRAAIKAIEQGKNRYTPSAGLPELRQRISAELKAAYGRDLSVMITAGVSGGLTLSLLAIVDPGDEVIFLDPYFVSYFQLVSMLGGRPVPIPSYPDFRFDARAVEAAITPRTKAIMINSPGNPTGRVQTEDEVRAAAELAQKHGLLLISDEIYDKLCYDGPNPCPMPYAPDNTLLLRGYGKTYGITGWRMGYAAGPETVVGEMTKFQQYTFVCAPSPAQVATLTALHTDVSDYRQAYTKKRDLVCTLLEPCFEFQRPSGGFYVFPKVPSRFANATEFCEKTAEQNVLVIPGSIFSSRDTHFRISYATADDLIRRGCEVLCRLARG
ncbi:MAG TPA: aminotransferase class I/II-fold pyridoxal phosphate-dependent enzyme [Phycisphaerae bacterium]|nr:aminotransferase class I/II-fold pyridoxal phosphate-dependent enzyme [Phycisphaerae bacterium]